MESKDDTRLHIVVSHLSSFVNVRKRSISVQGRPVSYLEKGRGTPIVLLHGFCCNKSNWRGVMRRFDLEGYRLIAPDVPGFHLAQIDPSLSYTGRFYNEWLEGFLNLVNSRDTSASYA